MKIKILALCALNCFIFIQVHAFTATELEHRTLERRAVEAALWGMPLVNFNAMRHAYFRDAHAHYNDIIYWSKPANWKFQVPTPNNSINYFMFFINLKKGAVVVEVPPVEEASLFGSLIDAWNIPLADVGDTGQERGKGGKYLLLPPDFTTQIPSGYIPVYSSTYNIYGLMKLIPNNHSAAKVAQAISYLKKLKIHPLSEETTSHFIDMSDKLYEGIAPYDARFYELLDQMVKEEPIDEHDVAMMGQLSSLGIGKNMTFKPNSQMQKVFQQAIEEAHSYMVSGCRKMGILWWPEGHWHSINKDALDTKYTFLTEGGLLLDERAYTFYETFGVTYNALPNLYLLAFEDKDGELLNGSFTYKLHLPAHVPTTQFWSVVVYNTATAGFIRDAAVVGVDSYAEDLKKNADGSIDIFFAPTAPQGYATNWISTKKGGSFFVFFRNYGADKSALERKSPWVLTDLEKIK